MPAASSTSAMISQRPISKESSDIATAHEIPGCARPYDQRGARHQPHRLRHHLQTPRHDRVGVILSVSVFEFRGLLADISTSILLLGIAGTRLRRWHT